MIEVILKYDLFEQINSNWDYIFQTTIGNYFDTATFDIWRFFRIFAKNWGGYFLHKRLMYGNKGSI